MTDDELRAHRDRLMDAVLTIEDAEDSPDTESTPADPPLAQVGPKAHNPMFSACFHRVLRRTTHPVDKRSTQYVVQK
jgi:hypothetical protein